MLGTFYEAGTEVMGGFMATYAGCARWLCSCSRGSLQGSLYALHYPDDLITSLFTSKSEVSQSKLHASQAFAPVQD